ncbi:ERV/ALR sulfhydryl oxidase domain-containing protein [Hygrophoropsis aurantiaca]|uniref:ERV/ALR sulfhydryl oxidase domain-containing protein n=1 Tax=Hygrophoropsis aurantiaca TaxID=72124 RepID=A0ACB8ADK1_9AGAM|nr:ERV/ALR sulfhydryl oxidase domain-containing protein [Hygrophoropsis aurantiaca]
MISRFARSFLVIILALFLLGSLTFFHAPSRAYIEPLTGDFFGEGGSIGIGWGASAGNAWSNGSRPGGDIAAGGNGRGGVIMGKLANETAKAELGRATWKLLHTMTLRFPEHPTSDERSALASYMHLTARLYPCGECAAEFTELLRKFPPQTSSRLAASLWLCSVHNEVNARLKKPTFDCAHLDATYDCGCGPDDDKDSSASSLSSKDVSPDGSDSDPQSDEGHRGLMDLEWDPARDGVTGAELIKGGR